MRGLLRILPRLPFALALSCPEASAVGSWPDFPDELGGGQPADPGAGLEGLRSTRLLHLTYICNNR